MIAASLDPIAKAMNRISEALAMPSLMHRAALTAILVDFRDEVRAVAPAGAVREPSIAALMAASQAVEERLEANGFVIRDGTYAPQLAESAVRAAYAVDFGAAAPRDAPPPG